VTARVSILSVALCFTLPTQISARDRQAEVREATSRFLTAFNNLDWEAFRKCWQSSGTEFGATVMFPPLPANVTSVTRAKRQSGSDAETVWRQIFDAVRQRSGRSAPPYQNIQPQDLVVDMIGDSAAIVSFHLGDDKRISRRTIVWKHASDGWKIVHLHGSAIDVPQ
jgi:hypothetical protein